jgi:3-methyladenine DNA glycosylase AlkD
MTSLAKQIEEQLAPLGTHDRAVGAKAYLKSDLGFFGVTAPQVRATVKAITRDLDIDHDQLVATVGALWARPVFELRSSAVELLAYHVELLGPKDIALLERLVAESKTWALVDFLSTAVIGVVVEQHPALTKTLDRWSIDEDFWIRRAAMLSLLVPMRRGGGDFERFARYADTMLEEKEFFIRKAIGWILREVSRKRPQLVVDWLAPRVNRAAGLTIREATRHLTVKQQMAVMAKLTPKAKQKRAPRAR